jgi:hypothetical protein
MQRLMTVPSRSGDEDPPFTALVGFQENGTVFILAAAAPFSTPLPFSAGWELRQFGTQLGFSRKSSD